MDFEPFRTLSMDSFEPANPEGLGLRKIMAFLWFSYGFLWLFFRGTVFEKASELLEIMGESALGTRSQHRGF